MKIALVPREYVGSQVKTVKEYLREAALQTSGRCNEADLVKSVVDFEYELWLVYNKDGIKGIVLTKFIQYPQKKNLEISFAAGDGFWDSKVTVMDTLLSWAASNGCEDIELKGRKGWVKALADYDAIEEGVMLRLPVA